MTVDEVCDPSKWDIVKMPAFQWSAAHFAYWVTLISDGSIEGQAARRNVQSLWQEASGSYLLHASLSAGQACAGLSCIVNKPYHSSFIWLCLFICHLLQRLAGRLRDASSIPLHAIINHQDPAINQSFLKIWNTSASGLSERLTV